MEKNEIIGLLKQQGVFKNLIESSSSVFKKRKLSFGFSFIDIVEGVETKFLVGFDKNFPLNLPSFFIENYDGYEFIPHIEEDGKVCYTHDDYIYLDADQPGEIIQETYQLAKDTIEKGLIKENISDFLTEFEAYWNRLQGSEEILANIKIGECPTSIKIGFHQKTRIALSEGPEYLNNVSRFINLDDKGTTFKNAILIPVNLPEGFIPPRYNEPLKIHFLKSLISLLDTRAKSEFEKLSKKNTKSEEYVIFSFSHSEGTTSLFGVKFSNIKSVGHPLTSVEFQGAITPLSIDRLDKDYLYKRGGNGEMASDKRGVIIGGGSVGSFITEELVRNGFFDLTIVDGDILTSANCYRHLSGFLYYGKNKAVAIKSKIEKYFPHCKIEAIEDNIENALQKKKINFEDYDFIIIATGNVSINTYLNKILHNQFMGKPVLYAWNDPYGIGGHCLLTNVEKKGCYTCLYSNEESYNMASFADSKQSKSFLKKISGCGSIYTPYGSIDSMQTCILTIKVLIDVMKGREKKNAIFSWKGIASIFLKEGYVLSKRFEMTDAQLNEKKHDFVNSNCKICQI